MEEERRTNTIIDQYSALLKELSDIKTNMAVNTSETSNIKNHIAEIKVDIKEIKSLYVTHNEFKVGLETASDHETRLRSIESKVWKAIGAIAIAQVVILPIVLYLFYQLLQSK